MFPEQSEALLPPSSVAEDPVQLKVEPDFTFERNPLLTQGIIEAFTTEGKRLAHLEIPLDQECASIKATLLELSVRSNLIQERFDQKLQTLQRKFEKKIKEADNADADQKKTLEEQATAIEKLCTEKIATDEANQSLQTEVSQLNTRLRSMELSFVTLVAQEKTKLKYRKWASRCISSIYCRAFREGQKAKGPLIKKEAKETRALEEMSSDKEWEGKSGDEEEEEEISDEETPADAEGQLRTDENTSIEIQDAAEHQVDSLAEPTNDPPLNLPGPSTLIDNLPTLRQNSFLLMEEVIRRHR